MFLLKTESAARRKTADLELQAAEGTSGFGQIFFAEGGGVQGKHVSANASDLNAVEAEVLGHGVNVFPGKIGTAERGEGEFHGSCTKPFIDMVFGEETLTEKEKAV